jgi:FSR family fosmidomycin resistance protein-like MFS transporter
MAQSEITHVASGRSAHRFWLLALPIGAILMGHYVVDTYSSIMPPLLGVVETDFGMRPQWAAVLLGLGSICSGLAQPLFAWISDRLNTRVFGAIGMTLGALGITAIGYMPDVSFVFLSYAIGMTGIGMFHPIAASTIGRLTGHRRGIALSWFFLFGMGGFFTGSLVGPALATGGGSLRTLSYLMLPGLAMAIALQLAISKIGHKHEAPVSKKHPLHLPVELRYDWRSISILYLSAVFRFIVNMALVYLLVRWMEQYFAAVNPGWTAGEVADYAAPFAGRANATMIVGQGVGGLAAGAVIKSGREKLPMIVTPILFAPALATMAFAGPGWIGYAACFCAGVGFASMTPVAISVGQRLMPRHTSLASGLMLGGAWAVASLGPRSAEFLIQCYGLKTGLISCGGVLALSGIAAMGLNQNSLDID